MKVISVNIGKIQTQPWRDGTLTAMHKAAVEGQVKVGFAGLEGDEQADKQNHGGVDKAIFVMPAGNYQRFQIERPFGFLGENITVSGVDETEVCLGDRFQIGNVLLEVTQPRSPCWKLGKQAQTGSHWKASEFMKTYAENGRVGFYCRVLAEGEITAEQSINWLTRNDTATSRKQGFVKIPIDQLYLAKQFVTDTTAIELLKQAIQHPALSQAWLKSIQTILASKS